MPAKAKTKSREAQVREAMALIDASKIMNEVEEVFQLQGSMMDKEVRKSTLMSTGILTLDLLYGGGYFPGGWYTNFGDEQVGKSTVLYNGMTSILVEGVPLAAFMEPEGTSTEEYLQNIASLTVRFMGGGPIDMSTVFGKKDKSGKYVIEPRVRYYPENVLQKIWKSLAAVIRRLPDKDFIEDEWWLLFPRTKTNISRFKGKADPKMSKKKKKIAIRSPDGGRAQAVLMVDSFASMTAETADTDDGDESMALDARGHSRHAKKVKGLLRRKHVLLLGVNHVSSNIKTRGGGPTEVEAGGRALRRYSDVRLRMGKRKHPKAEGYEEVEKSVDGSGGDTYRFVGVKTIKNKYSTPNIEDFLRIWEQDANGDCQGIDPVWDTWNYLQLTGQCRSMMATRNQPTTSWTKGKHEVVMYPLDPEAAEGEMFSLPPLKWEDFKKLILLRGAELKAHCAKFGIKSNPRLRQRCFEQVRDGLGVKLFHENR